MSNTAQPNFTPGPWIADNCDTRVWGVRGPDGIAIAFTGGTDPLRGFQQDGANARLIAAAPSLYAYAKAEALRKELANAVLAELDENTNVAPGTGDAAEQVYRSHLATMGWDGKEYPSDFLATYRATALTLAEGGGK